MSRPAEKAMPAVALLLLISIASLTACTDLGNPVGGGNTDISQLPDTLSWTGDVYPDVIQPYCIQCHGNGLAQNGLNFQNYNGWIDETSFNGNPYVVPGQPDASELVWRVEGTHNLPRMPQGGQLPSTDITIIRQWIEQGAHKDPVSASNQ